MHDVHDCILGIYIHISDPVNKEIFTKYKCFLIRENLTIRKNKMSQKYLYRIKLDICTLTKFKY